MSAKKNFNYFDEFRNQVSLSKLAAEQLNQLLNDYHDVSLRADLVHNTEHEGDKKLREIMNELNVSFITPIDREDIVSLANAIDDITDSIEDVANLFDMFVITEVRPEAKALAELIVQGCGCLYDAINEFADFKDSKRLRELVRKVNQVEAEADRTHRSVIKTMCTSNISPMEFIIWKDIYDAMETVLDYCEVTADLLDGLAIKNS